MKKLLTLTLLLLTITGFAQFNSQNVNLSMYHSVNYSFTSPDIDNTRYEAMIDSLKVVEDEWTKNDMRIYPIIATKEFEEESKISPNYLSLQEALDTGAIAIHEVSSSGTVNTVSITNLGKDTIFIMAGEIVLGGKQDRAIGEQLILPPDAKNVLVKVFCVEHGRWSQNGTGTDFKGYYGIAGNQVRKKVVVDKNQGEVWSEISKTHEKAGANSSTGSFKDIKNSEEFQKQVSEIKEHFKAKLLNVDNLIGFVIVSGSNILGAELFSSQDLLNKQLESLLESYVVEALQVEGELTVTTAQVDEFIRELLAEDKQEELIKEKGTDLKVNNKTLHMSILNDD
ncbi:hypothetical protein GYB22_03270 [bacterium]|nr:hypothetical protein [bacterium]